MSFIREQTNVLLKRMTEPRRFIQVLFGPRQVGKTTAVQKLKEQSKSKVIYTSADIPGVETGAWLDQQWDESRIYAAKQETILVLDEIQKVTDWSRIVKKNWDQDTLNKLNLKIVLLGSAPLLVQKGLSESLAGRFEQTLFPHWSFTEMEKTFGTNLNEYIFFGSYPGAHSLQKDFDRWKNYILDSIIEPTISRDILLMQRVDKPALLRSLFLLGCRYSSRELAYQKICGQLQDAGNTTTIAHYLDILNSSWFLGGLEKYSGSKVRQRSSSPKFQVFNNALFSACTNETLESAQKKPEVWGQFVESAIGCHLLNSARERNTKIQYWRESDFEVDFVVSNQDKVTAIEVKSGRTNKLSGLAGFKKKYPKSRIIVVGPQTAISVEEFFKSAAEDWL